MATLVQCDFCGEITNQIAAQIDIVFNSRLSVMDEDLARSILTVGSDAVYSRQGPAHSVARDCCIKCVKKFVEVKQVPLAITPEVSEKL